MGKKTPDTNAQVTRESLVKVDGGNLFVKSWIPSEIKDQTPVFLFHDSLGCVRLWRDFPALLSEQLGKVVIAYDRLGFGESSQRVNLHSTRFVNEEAEIYFPKVLESLGIERFDLFGHSVGGGMAIACAARLEGCRSVVTESAQAFVEARTLEGISKAKEEFKDPKNFERLVKYHGSKTSWVLRAWTEIWLSPEFAGWSLAPLLAKTHCPILAIHGDNDEYGTKAFPEMIRDRAAGKSDMSVIPNCGHVPHREKPELILSLVSEFYQQLNTQNIPACS